MDPTSARVAAHYGRPDLLEGIRSSLTRAGVAWDQVRPEDLAPIDQFHTRGREATLELAELAGVSADSEVLDLGGGLGGPARTLAASFGCRVTVLDLTPEFCEAGTKLTQLVGLSTQVTFEVGDALALPYDTGRFDIVWTQHSSMNIPDKPRLYAEARRVLRAGGTLAMHEIAAGPGPGIRFPVPWASRAELSFLLSDAALRAAIRAVGFRERAWVDVTDASRTWVEDRLAAGASAAARGAPPSPGVGILLGDGMRDAFHHLHRGLADGGLRVIEAVFEPSAGGLTPE